MQGNVDAERNSGGGGDGSVWGAYLRYNAQNFRQLSYVVHQVTTRAPTTHCTTLGNQCNEEFLPRK